MAFQPGAFQAGAFQGAGGNRLAAVETGEDTFSGVAATKTQAALAAIEGAVDQFAGASSTATPATLTAREQGADSFSGTGALLLLRARESGADAFSGLSDSEGQIIIIPREVEGGTAYLLELAGYNPATSSVVNVYFSTDGFNSLPTDEPANVHYAARVKIPGNYERSLFSTGTTSGELNVGAGLIELVNMDGDLDYLRGLAFDGYELRVRSIPRLNPKLQDAVLVFTGTTEQVELSWEKATIRIRDRLAEVDKPIQTVTYAGTTISGGMTEAEGKPDDLKGAQKPTAWGAPANVGPVMSNQFDLVFDLGQNGLQGVSEVRDKGVPLTATGIDYPTTAQLIAASVPEGSYSTCLTKGQIALGSTPDGQVTAAPVEGANTAARTAAQVAKRMLVRMGFVEGTAFLASDITKLDALNSAQVGYWTGTEEVSALSAVGDVLGSIGAMISPDRLGVFRMFRFGPPTVYPKVTLTRSEILETSGRGFQLLATGDEGKGIPAWKVTVKYRRNWVTMTRGELETAASESFKAFAEQEWRSAIAEDEAVKAKHLLSPELTFETYLLNEADAIAEAQRRLAMHSVKRDRFLVPVKAYFVERVDLGDVVRLRLNRFGLGDGKDFTVIGLTENLQTGITTLDIWG